MWKQIADKHWQHSQTGEHVFGATSAEHAEQVSQEANQPVTAPIQFPVLSAVQVRLALLSAGITPAMVEAAIQSLPAGIQHDTARTYWEYAVQFHREHPFIGAFSGALGLTSEQVDDMWHAAAAIT
jgi:hypothetical protein